MPKKVNTVEKIGDWSFIGGVILAVLVGAWVGLDPSVSAATTTTIATVLVFLGILAGLIKIGTKETQGFLVAAIALLVAGTAGLQLLPIVGTLVQSILNNIVTFVAPVAVIVALKAVKDLAR